MEKVVTRFPPSPTGYLHIGGARTALFNYLFARHAGGSMILRFEDTDRERSKKEFEEDIFNGLRWLGISYEKPDTIRQSERGAVYQKYIDTLLHKDLAYEAEGTKDDADKKVIRFRNPNTTIAFTDLVRGEVTFDTTELGDFIIARSAAEPLYHFAVVVDDYEMAVTHVIRGEDHISNTPRQILILEALGFTRPKYAHIPLILAPDRTKLSKRHGAVSVNEYRAQGFIPEALLNYLALLGWNPGGEKEIYSLDELARLFTLDKIHKNGAIFDIGKLRWFNKEHLKLLSDEEYASHVSSFMKETGKEAPSYLTRALPLIRERAETLEDAAHLLLTECSFLGDVPPPVTKELLLRGAKADEKTVEENLNTVADMLTNISEESWNAAHIKDLLFPYADMRGRASVLWPLRTALSGQEKSPDPFTLAALLGKETTLSRIASAHINALQ